MSVYVKHTNIEILCIKNKEPLIAEGFWSKLTSLFGSKNKDKVSKLKKNRKFMSLLKGLNNDWDKIAKHIEDAYGQKVKFEKFTVDDFK